MKDALKEFMDHDYSLWSGEKQVIRICKAQTRIIQNELEKTVPEVSQMSSNKANLFFLHMFEISLKERNPSYQRFCECNDHRTKPRKPRETYVK